MNEDLAISVKQKISNLITQVLIEKMTINEAIKHFPRDIEDPSIECAFHALIHYEADEDFRRQDPEYAEEQIEHLENIANLFKNNESLPINIIEEYKKYYEEVPLKGTKGLKSLLKRIFRLIV